MNTQDPEYKKKKRRYAQNYYSKPEKREMAKNRVLTKQYGLTLSDYRAMLQLQEHKCAICERSIKEGTAYVDHDHGTGKIRGILCNHCNLAIGHLQESLKIAESVVFYLIRSTKNERIN